MTYFIIKKLLKVDLLDIYGKLLKGNKMFVKPYDDSDPKSIEEYASKLVGFSFSDVIYNASNNEYEYKALVDYYKSPYGKGSLGNLLERLYFFYQPNSDPRPDFPKAGVELKVTPYEYTKKGELKAGERLVLSMIPFDRPLEDDLKESHLLEKIQLMLLIFYLRDREKLRTDYRIGYVNLFHLLSEQTKEDFEIIKDDYKKIVKKIKAGKAHELSEADTMYLGACTKGATAKSSYRSQYYSDIPAKSRAFSLKQSYMRYMLNHYIVNEVETYQPAFTDEDLKHSDFETVVLNKINSYVGSKANDLYKKFNLRANVKSVNHLLVMRILGVNTENAQEFEKANIQIKTIRVKKDGKLREHMSFPNFVIKDFIDEDWDNSEIYELFSQTKFMFVVFKENEDGEDILQGAKFWTMPVKDLENEGKKEWKMFQEKFLDGINFRVKENTKGGYIVDNDIPTAKDTVIFHVRLHSSQTAYIIDGVKYGKGSESNMDTLSNGDKMTKQCFWLNKDYVKEQIEELIEGKD